MVHVLVTVGPRMYREAIALALQRARPYSEVMLAPEDVLDGQVGEFAPHVLVRTTQTCRSRRSSSAAWCAA